MTDYQNLYCLLFNKITDVIEELQQVQQEAEERYLNEEATALLIMINNKDQPD